MVTKQQVIDSAGRIGFADIGFTGAGPFLSQIEYFKGREQSYAWTERVGLDLTGSIDPGNVLTAAKSVIVLLHSYYESYFPGTLEKNYGRCYLNDDRVTRDGLALKIKEFRKFLRESGVDSRLSASIPDKLAAASAGLGTFGKNCLFYASRAAGGSSFVFPVVLVVDADFEPDEPTVETDCPTWCRNACVAACPTGALLGGGRIEPNKCISYLTYYGEGITPRELREPMGQYIYGCDRCQNVCPRNNIWLTKEREEAENSRLLSEIFNPGEIFMMNREYFNVRVWPRMFYMSYDDVWRWRMNAARAMGNSRDKKYVPVLVKGFSCFDDHRVTGMAAWALGRIGGAEAEKALLSFRVISDGTVLAEVESALETSGGLMPI